MENVGKYIVIDTGILVDMLRGSEEAVTFIAELERKELTLSTTIINAFELYYGAYKSKKKVAESRSRKKTAGENDYPKYEHKIG